MRLRGTRRLKPAPTYWPHSELILQCQLDVPPVSSARDEAESIYGMENTTIRLSIFVSVPSWPPADMATNCFPLTSYVIGTERALVGSGPRHKSLPVSTS